MIGTYRFFASLNGVFIDTMLITIAISLVGINIRLKRLEHLSKGVRMRNQEDTDGKA